jgi:hypothetical protein
VGEIPDGNNKLPKEKYLMLSLLHRAVRSGIWNTPVIGGHHRRHEQRSTSSWNYQNIVQLERIKAPWFTN